MSAEQPPAPADNKNVPPVEDDPGVIKEFIQFLREEKMYWITPIVLVLLALGALLILTEGSAVAPFIYTLF